MLVKDERKHEEQRKKRDRRSFIVFVQTIFHGVKCAHDSLDEMTCLKLVKWLVLRYVSCHVVST